MKRTWYKKYIGYHFQYNGKGVRLIDIYYWENGKATYEFEYDDGTGVITDTKGAKELFSQTDLPK